MVPNWQQLRSNLCGPQVYIHANLETAKFYLAKQNLNANIPLPKASASCPPEPPLSKTDKGLIAVGTVLAVIVVGGLSYAAYRWLFRRIDGQNRPDSNGGQNNGSIVPRPPSPPTPDLDGRNPPPGGNAIQLQDAERRAARGPPRGMEAQENGGSPGRPWWRRVAHRLACI